MSRATPGLRILFVCTGNTCRSPLAAAALRAELRAELGEDASRVAVESAGTGAWEGQPATSLSVDVAAGDGISLRDHQSRRLTAPMVRSSDWIVVMEPAHLGAVRALGADPEHTFVLSEWPPPGDPTLTIDDPFGGSREAYEECWRRIRHHVKRLMPQVLDVLRTRSA
jgi:protein-tyrosine phosphatase